MSTPEPPKTVLTEEQAELQRKRKEKKKAQQEAKAAKAAKAKEKRLKMEQNQNKGKASKKDIRIKKEFVNTTPKGEKKDLTGEMASAYDPPAVEASWYDWWIEQGYFSPKTSDTAEKFVMVIPPPNVTGSLHIGHALTNSVQDSLTRWHRMKGHSTLWLPGTDHAGIATQVVVEKKLKKERNINRHDIGREKFVEEVWKWKNEYGGRIKEQLSRLGSSLDWDREVFTMDEKLSTAVTEAFVQFYDKNLIYRATRLVNWCPILKTAISDIEVDREELTRATKRRVPGHGDKMYEFGTLTSFAYPIEDSDEEIVVATTRIETMLADTGVAVHPDDDRYKKFHGKNVIHPFNGRKIPIVCDKELVDMEFGTGAVKVTPAHDQNDFETGKRHDLEFINLLNLDGTINEVGGEFEGMKRFDARIAVLEKLKEKGLYKGVEDNAMSLGICSRSGDVIEPFLIPQWWVDTTDMAQRAVEVVEKGEVKIFPESHVKTWNKWLTNIHPWCISRQLWWGHRIPAYLVLIDGKTPNPGENSSNWVVGRNEAEAMERAVKKFNVEESKISLEQDPDVLDTWFSSGLFPFSVFGWPNQTEDLAKFYPGALLETGTDILFFWVARMVMMGLTLTEKAPFKEVLLHSLVRDAHGDKMSKSSGNVIDPVDVMEGIPLEGLHKKLLEGNLDQRQIEKAKKGQREDFPKGISECGADALRFALCAYMSQGRDINLDINRVVAYRNFCNKLWNATRFAMTHLGNDFKPAEQLEISNTSIMDQWILSRTHNAVTDVNQGFQTFAFEKATTSCYNFWLYDLCDAYLESIKPIMHSDDELQKEAARQTLYTALDIGLKLLHPFMPFVTEELYQRLPRRPNDAAQSIMIATFPEQDNIPSTWSSEDVETMVSSSQRIIRAIRSLRSSYNIPQKEKTATTINLKNDSQLQDITKCQDLIKALAYCASVTVVVNQDPPKSAAVDIVDQQTEIFLDIKDLIDIDAEIKKLGTKLKNFQLSLDGIHKKMGMPDYENKAPQKVKDNNDQKLKSLAEEIANTEKAIKNFESFKN